MTAYSRRCRKHQLTLDEVGDVLLCPAGNHVCEDFQVIDRKTGAVANEVPEDEQAAPKTPPPGAVDVVRGLAGGVRAKKEPKRMQQKNHRKGEPFPHGTHQRYFQEVKSGSGKPCEPCRAAAAKYSKARREARLLAAGKTPNPAPVVRSQAARPPKRAALVAVSPAVAPREGLSLSAIANEIQSLRRQLARREADFAREVGAVLPNYKLLPSFEVEVVDAISTSKRGRAA